MKRYSETQGSIVINWRETLRDAMAGAFETVDDYGILGEAALSDAAAHWSMCAIGQLDARLPREPHSGAPTDDLLVALGGAFSEAVDVGEYQHAARILTRIETRAAEILALLDSID